MDWLVAASGPAGALTLFGLLLTYVVHASRRAQKVLDETVDQSHDRCELVDIRSDVMAPNELVATLCVTHDVQLEPAVWQRKMDRELAELEPKPIDKVFPTDVRELDTAYVTIEPMVQAIRDKTVQEISRYSGRMWVDPDPEPTSSWTYRRFVQYGWRMVDQPQSMSPYESDEFSLLSVTMAKGDQRYMIPMTRLHYDQWRRR